MVNDPIDKTIPAYNEFKVGDIVVRIGDLTRYVVQSVNVDWQCQIARSRFTLWDTKMHKFRCDMDGYWMQKECVKVGYLRDGEVDDGT